MDFDSVRNDITIPDDGVLGPSAMFVVRGFAKM